MSNGAVSFSAYALIGDLGVPIIPSLPRLTFNVDSLNFKGLVGDNMFLSDFCQSFSIKMLYCDVGTGDRKQPTLPERVFGSSFSFLFVGLGELNQKKSEPKNASKVTQK